MKYRLLVPSALFLMALVFLVQFFLALPASADDSNKRIARLSFVEGTVQYQRPGQQWADASVNLPIQEGFSLRTADGYAEVEFENSFTVRIGTNSNLEFTKLTLPNGARDTQLTIPQGTAMISAKLAHAEAVSVAAANLNINVSRDGRFRVDVSPQETWVSVFHGKVEVNPGSGAAAKTLGAGATLYEVPSAPSSLKTVRGTSSDAFDKWVNKREDGVDAATALIAQGFGSTDYSQGFGDLYMYGTWSQLPGMGIAWIPNGVEPTWTPFVNGRWQFMGHTGWNWVSNEPWGWIPYHFGSWVNVSGTGWAWLPNGATHDWRPAVAKWVRLNDQLGWVPDGPPQSGMQQDESSIFILAQVAPGVIRAGEHVSLGQPGAGTRPVPAPAPAFVAPAAAANQPGSAPPSTGVGAMLASFRTPGAAAAIQPQLAKLSPNPPLMLAPRAAALPANFQRPETADSDNGLSYNLVKGSCPCYVMTSTDMVNAQLPPQ